AAAEDIQRSGGKAEGLALDVTETGRIHEVIGRIGQRHGRLDILINNAGTNRRMPCLEMDPASWDLIVNTNLKGPFFCAQAAAQIMQERGYGKIINVASLQSEMAARNGVVYAASKGGIRQMTKGLAVELAQYGIRVNAIGPGTFPTDLNRGLFENPEWVKQQHLKIPLGRVGKLEELAGAAIYLASSASDYMTGQILYIDGGYLSALF
ncbi:MAG: SDR family oxidoreductase, partial [candidate division NC10 bacterium]|nr:SDR family oxidoreductase [candidate division NC10 bacterium]